MKDYYAQLDKAIKQHEDSFPYPQYRLDWIADKIGWCHKWKKLSIEQIHDLADRVTALYEEVL